MNAELTEEQVAELHERLLALRAELVETAVTTAEHAGTVELDQAAVGRISRVDALQQQSMAQAQQRRNELRGKQIAVALAMFADGDYGWCKVCGDPIGYGRLSARPESVCCVPCMREVERGT